MLRVRVLGELELDLDGSPVELPASRRARSLLGMLALERREHPRSQLAAAFWPDVLDASARTSLRAALSALRRSLGPAADRYLVATRDRVGLREDVWTDTATFDRLAVEGDLQAALELYRGDLLSGLDDDWIGDARDEWGRRVAAVLERLAVQAEQDGDRAAAVGYTRRVVALDPLGEEGQRALIRRLADGGDRAAALAAYAQHAERLRTELRVAPSPATRALVDELRNADGAPEPVAETLVDAPAARSTEASGTVTLLFTDLVGSTELLMQLGDEGAERLRRLHFGLLRDVALAHAGTEVKNLGDGLMIVFASAVHAASCAIAIQQAVERHNRREGNDHLRVRVGLNAGEPIRDEGDYFGTPVVVAARLCARAEGGQILASELVRLLIGGRGDFDFRPLGELALKGLSSPIAACELGWEAAGVTHVPLPVALARDPRALAGRAAEMASLQDAWQRAREGQAGVVVVGGEPGIGKTRLVTELCRRAHADGATVLLGASYEDTLVPYQPFVEAIGQYVSVCPVEELRLQIGTRRRALAKLVPELGDGEDVPVGAGETRADGEGERFALFDAVASTLREIARTRPTVLVLDDLHWSDEPSLLLLAHVARSAADAPLLVLGTYRDTEVSAEAPLAAVLAQLRRARMLEVIPLVGLDVDDVASLIRDCGAAAPDDLARTVAERTEGNPFFVEEIVRHLDAEGEDLVVPDSVKDLLLRRLRGLGESTRDVLRAAAVLGREFELGALEHVMGSKGDDAIEALEEALSERVLVESREAVARYGFTHALIRETIYEQLSGARRARLHLRAGTALEELHATQLDSHAAQIARHFVQAGEDLRSLDYLLLAARDAARVFATNVALEHYAAALECGARLGVTPDNDERLRRALLERGWLREVIGDQAAVADYGRALQAFRVAGDRRLEAEALDSLGFAEKSLDAERSRAHQREALDIATDLGDVPLQVRILGRMSIACSNHLDLAGAVAAGERAFELANTVGADQDRALALDALKLAALQLGDLDRLDRCTAELEETERRRGDLWYLQWTLLESSFVPLARTQWDQAAARLDEALVINERIGDVLCRPLIHDAMCWLERSRGRLGPALAQGRTATALAESEGLTPWKAWTQATLGWALLELRAADEAVVVLERAVADAVMLADRLRATGHLAWASALAGDLARAEAAAGEAGETLAQLRVAPGGAFVFGFGAIAALARAHLAIGRMDQGQALAEPLLAAADRSDWHEATATASLVLGLCAQAGSDEQAARALLQRSVALASSHALPGVEWEAQAALATVSDEGEATDRRARSRSVVERIAADAGDERLATGFVHATER